MLNKRGWYDVSSNTNARREVYHISQLGPPGFAGIFRLKILQTNDEDHPVDQAHRLPGEAPMSAFVTNLWMAVPDTLPVV